MDTVEMECHVQVRRNGASSGATMQEGKRWMDEGGEREERRAIELI
jgi:hypothetical protein